MDIGKSLENKKASLEHKKKSLFITYDGLLDPLGGSQILPYLYSISVHPRGVHVISLRNQNALGKVLKGFAQNCRTRAFVGPRSHSLPALVSLGRCGIF